MSDIVHDKTTKFQTMAFNIFAIFGFLGSVVTIISFFGSSSASISATITPINIEVPKAVQLGVIERGNYDLESSLEEMKSKFCNPVAVDYDGTKSRNIFFDQGKCDDHKIFSDVILEISK